MIWNHCYHDYFIDTEQFWCLNLLRDRAFHRKVFGQYIADHFQYYQTCCTKLQHSKAFDGASNMCFNHIPYQYSGLSSRIKDTKPSSYLVLYAHVLKLVISYTARCLTATTSFRLLQQTQVFLRNSHTSRGRNGNFHEIFTNSIVVHICTILSMITTMARRNRKITGLSSLLRSISSSSYETMCVFETEPQSKCSSHWSHEMEIRKRCNNQNVCHMHY